MKPMTVGRKQIGIPLYRCCLLLCFLLALLLRLSLLSGYSSPTTADGGRLMRPDSASYIDAARSLAYGRSYSLAPDDPAPMTQRPPGYPVLVALCLRIAPGLDLDKGLRICITLGVLLGACTSLVVAACGRILFGRTAGLVAGLFHALSLTAIAASPMFLADNLLGLFCALQTLFLLKCFRKPSMVYFCIAVLCAILAVYVKPVNQPFVLVLLPFLVVPAIFRTWKPRILAAAGVWILFAVLVCPWMYRNARCGAGFSVDSNTGLTALHNTAAILARAEHRDGDTVRHELETAAEQAFLADPDAYSTIREKNAYFLGLYRKSILEHPGSFLATHFLQVWILLPDLPSYLECVGQSVSGRGTLAVLRRHGPVAAIRHYLGDTHPSPLYLAVGLLLSVAAGIMYLFACVPLWIACRRRMYRFLILFACLALYYLMVPGPVLMPRYQLPALPLLCAMAGIGVTLLFKKKNARKNMC